MDTDFIESLRLQEELYLQRVAQLDEITTERDKFKRAYEDLRKQRLNEFMTGFNMITNKLKENYQMLTLGGDAELELVDSLDPFSEGIMFRYVTNAGTFCRFMNCFSSRCKYCYLICVTLLFFFF